MNPSRAGADQAIRLLEERGDRAYLGEAVSQLEHALQAAHLAVKAGSGPAPIAAALLHDVGHLLNSHKPHEEDGYRWLMERFGPAVAEPARLHVAAKRYLCRVDAEYFGRLSPASVESLALQGGPFNADQAREFEQQPYCREAVQLRRWDDEAKVPGLAIPALEEYRRILYKAAL